MAQHHFTRDDRVLLAKLKAAGLNNLSCARILGFHPSTIGRELSVELWPPPPATTSESHETALNKCAPKLTNSTVSYVRRKQHELLRCSSSTTAPTRPGLLLG
ncbi:helix-turn-helix domain-containing protein [Candidatus Saccharibacteria bacterium]|nr:helix-turn-helix domain-containing protein [Candidatus Saccharibacteria bacterium]